jgi:hypothetical protein
MVTVIMKWRKLGASTATGVRIAATAASPAEWPASGDGIRCIRTSAIVRKGFKAGDQWRGSR